MADDQSSADQADQRYLRWQERALQQVGFLNNVLIGLGAGLVGLALARSARLNAAPKDRWQGVVIAIAFIVITVSVALGLLVACVRLRSIRMTASRNRVNYLRIKYKAGQTTRRKDLERHYERWAKWSRKNPVGLKSRELKQSANDCLESPELDPYKNLHTASRDWERGLDEWSWRFLWLEFIFFGAGAVMLAVIAICQNI
jgi:hypothetical protein